MLRRSFCSENALSEIIWQLTFSGFCIIIKINITLCCTERLVFNILSNTFTGTWARSPAPSLPERADNVELMSAFEGRSLNSKDERYSKTNQMLQNRQTL